MAELKFPGVCEYCPASMVCTVGAHSHVTHTRCMVCEKEVVVFYSEHDIRDITKVRVDRCPLEFSGSYVICESPECVQTYPEFYRRWRSGDIQGAKRLIKVKFGDG